MLLKLDWQHQDSSVIHPKADSTKNDLVKKGLRASFIDYKMRTKAIAVIHRDQGVDRGVTPPPPKFVCVSCSWQCPLKLRVLTSL